MQIDTARLEYWKKDPLTTGIVAVIALVFIGWRLVGSGTHGSAELLDIIKNDFVEDYRYSLYKQAEIEDKVRNSATPSEYWAQMGAEFDVQFSNTSVAAPLFSWSINEPVIVNFDYKLLHDGEVVKAETDQYLEVRRIGNHTYPSGPIRFYMKKFL